MSTHTHINNEHLTVVYQDGGSISRFHIINKAWTVERIRETIKENNSKNIGSIFLVDRRIMPLKHQGQATNKPAEDWLAILQVFTDGNIYVYDPAESWSIRPVHLKKEYIGTQYTLRLHVGDVVDFSALQPGLITTKSELLNGFDHKGQPITRSYLFAHFGQLKFWKKREEAAKKAREEQEERARRYDYYSRGRNQRERASDDGDGDWERTYYRWGANNPGSDWQRRTDDRWGANDSNFDDFFNWYRAGGFSGFGGQRRERSGTSSQTYAGGNDYTVLGISSSASDAEVKQAYRTLVRQHHPDKRPDDVESATKVTQCINAAYDRIKKARGVQ